LIKVTRAVVSNGDEKVGHFLLDSLTKFITGNGEAKFLDNGQAFFESVEILDGHIRKIEHLNLEKKVIEEMMQKITGESGKPESGEIFQLISNDREVSRYIDFYPFFRLLSKICHLAFTKRKEAAHIRKETKTLDEIKRREVDIETQTTILEQLQFHQTLQDEPNRIRTGEMQEFRNKQAAVNNKL